jgi:hypothetical protein
MLFEKTFFFLKLMAIRSHYLPRETIKEKMMKSKNWIIYYYIYIYKKSFQRKNNNSKFIHASHSYLILLAGN